jgi:hypothetical protein
MTIKYVLLPLCILNLLVVFCSHKESTDDIIEVFNTYITSAKAKDYNKLSEIVSSTTLSYFNNCISKAIYARREEIAQFPLFDKILVFYIRGSIPKEQVYSLDAKKLIRFSYEIKLANIDSLQNMRIKDVKIQNKIATAVITDAQANSCPIEFEKEGTEWKINIVPIINMINLSYKTNSHSKNNDELIISLLKSELNIPVDTLAIFEPINNR